MIKVDSTTGAISWKYQTVPFELDGDPDWAAGVTVMSTSCGKLTASVQKDGWSYAIGPSGPQPQLPPEPHPQCPAPPPSPERAKLAFPPTTNGGWFTDCNQVHGDDDYRRPGAAWNDVFIVRTGGENLVIDGVGANASKLHALNACATAEQDRVRWITGDISNNTAANGHISFSSPTVSGGIVFIGTNQNKTDNKGHLVAFADPSVAPASQQVCSNPPSPCRLAMGPTPPCGACSRPGHPDAGRGSLASMRNEPVLAEGRVFVATTPSATSPNAGHVYILAREDDIIPEIFVPDSVTTIIESEWGLIMRGGGKLADAPGRTRPEGGEPSHGRTATQPRILVGIKCARSPGRVAGLSALVASPAPVMANFFFVRPKKPPFSQDRAFTSYAILVTERSYILHSASPIPTLAVYSV